MAAALNTPKHSIDSLMNRITLGTTCEDHVHLLLLQNSGIRIKIGIIYPWKQTQQGKVARTVEEITQAILQAFNIYQYVKNREDFILNGSGVPFFINNLNIRIDDEQHLVIDNTIVTQKIDRTKKAVNALRLSYEKGGHFEESENGCKVRGCHFKKLGNGHYEVSPCQDPVMPEILINKKKEVVISSDLNDLLHQEIKKAANIEPEIFREYQIAYRIDKNNLMQLVIRPIQGGNIIPIGAITTTKITPYGTVRKTVEEVAQEILKVFKEYQNKE